MRNAPTRHLAVLALTLGLLLTSIPARAKPMATVPRPAYNLVQVIQYYGPLGYYGRPRFYGRPHHYRNHRGSSAASVQVVAVASARGHMA